MKNKFDTNTTAKKIAKIMFTRLSKEIEKELKKNYQMTYMNEEYEALADKLYLKVIKLIK